MKSIFDNWNRVQTSIENWLATIAALSLFLIMVTVVLDVIMRYAFNAPLAWSYEFIAMYLMVMVFFFALSDTLRVDAHIAVDILHIHLKTRTRHSVLAIGYWLSIIVFLLIFQTSLYETWASFVNDEVTDGVVQWPIWLSYISVPIGVILLLSRLLFRAVGHTLSAITANKYIELPLVSGREKE